MAKNIIINFPTNIGDTILGLPVLDKIKANYPEGKITAIVSGRTKDILMRNNFIDEVVFFNKQWKFREKMKFAFYLRGKFDIMVDLKNSFLPAVLGTKQRSPFLRRYPENTHIKDKYLSLVNKIAPVEIKSRSDFILSEEEKNKWDKLAILPSLFIACTSLTMVKNYPYEYLKKAVKSLGRKYPIVILGSQKDQQFYKDILSLEGVRDLVGKTRMIDVFYLLKNYARLLLAVDSSILHMGSYLNIPLVALFGPTHPDRSHPYSEKHLVLQNKGLSCLPCEKGSCDFNYECMKIDSERVVAAIGELW